MKMTGHLKKGNVRLRFLWFLWVLLLANIHCDLTGELPPLEDKGAPPAVPQAPAAVASPGQIILTWESQEDVIYHLFYSRTAGIDLESGANLLKISNVVSPYTHEELMSGTTYYYRLTAVNSWGASELTEEVSATTPGPGAPPAKPEAPETMASIGQVMLTWESQENLIYHLFYSRTAGIDLESGTNIGRVSNVVSPYAHQGLMNGTTYYYRLTAVNPLGASPPSDEVSATTPGQGIPPEKPGTPTTMASEGQITLTWNSQPGVSYHLFHSTSAGVDVAVGTNVMRVSNVTSPYVHEELMNGTTYYYRLMATNSWGESPPTDEVSATTPAPGTPPAKPGTPTTMASAGQITLTWTPQSGVTYDLYHSTSAGIDPEGGTNVMRISNVTSPYAHQGLMSGTTYYYRLTAANSWGESPPSDEVSAGTPASGTPPAKPGTPTAMASAGQITLTWTPQSGVTYDLYHSTSAGIDPGSGTNVMRISNVTPPYAHTGLMSGTTYYYRLTAANFWGESPPSDEVSATTPAPGTPPEKPPPPTTMASEGQITLTWTPQSGVTYDLYHSTSAGVDPGSGTNVMRISNVTSPYAHQGLMSGTTYYYRLTATNSSGASPPSDEVSETTPGPNTPPATPQTPTPAVSEGQITLTWALQSGVTYDLYHSTSAGVDPGSGTNVMRVSNVMSPYTHTGLMSGTTYYYRLTAVNSAGASEPTPEVSATTPGPSVLPAKPQNFMATASEGQVTLTWTTQPDVTYHLFHSTSAGIDIASGMNVMRTLNVTPPHVHTGLMSGTTYYYRLTAVNSLGASEPTDEASAATPGPSTLPEKPRSFMAVASEGQVTLTWTPQPGATYELFYSKTAGIDVGSDTNLMGVSHITSPYVHTGLLSGTTYYYRLRAVNSLGASEPTDEASAATPGLAAPPQKPRNFTAAAAPRSRITLSWDVQTGVTYDLFYSRTAGFDLKGTNVMGILNVTPPYTHTGLLSDTTYHYRLTAVNSLGRSEPADEVSARVQLTATIQRPGLGAHVQGIAHGGGKFVAVGHLPGARINLKRISLARIATSSDGITWTTQTTSQAAGTYQQLHGVTYGGGKFVAVGQSGTILTSSDGITWALQQKTDPATMTMVNYTTEWLYDVTYGGGKFVAVGWSGTILTSSDGITWTSRTSGTTDQLNGVIHGGGKFVAVGRSGTILTSSDGITWAKRQKTSGSNMVNYTTDNLNGVIHGGGKFVAVGGNGTILTSTNGTTWTLQQKAGPGNTMVNYTTEWLSSVTHGGGKFAAVGWSGTILTSSDGITWTSRTSGVSNELGGVIHAGGKFVAVGFGGTVLTSSDGITWSLENTGLLGVTYGGGKFVAVGWSGTILTSSDGITWTCSRKQVPVIPW